MRTVFCCNFFSFFPFHFIIFVKVLFCFRPLLRSGLIVSVALVLSVWTEFYFHLRHIQTGTDAWKRPHSFVKYIGIFAWHLHKQYTCHSSCPNPHTHHLPAWTLEESKRSHERSHTSGIDQLSYIQNPIARPYWCNFLLLRPTDIRKRVVHWILTMIGKDVWLPITALYHSLRENLP